MLLLQLVLVDWWSDLYGWEGFPGDGGSTLAAVEAGRAGLSWTRQAAAEP